MPNISSNPRIYSVYNGLSTVFMSSRTQAEQVAWELSKVAGWAVNSITVHCHSLKRLPPRQWVIDMANGNIDSISTSERLVSYTADGRGIASTELSTQLRQLGFKHV
jgi:hypothetical protein